MPMLKKIFQSKECNLCSEIPNEISIHSINEFMEIVIGAKEWVKSGILTQSNKGLSHNFSMLIDIPEEPPFDDIVYTKLQCNKCRKKYELFADTYHGGNNNRWCKL